MRRQAVAIVICFVAIALGLMIAGDCDSPDWQQALMLTALPMTAWASAIVAALSVIATASGPRRRGGIRLIAAVLVGPAVWLITVMLWGAGCSS